MTLRVVELYAKLQRGGPMTRAAALDVYPEHGITGTATAGRTPRQVCIASAEDLHRHGVKPSASRANLILDGPGWEHVTSGAFVTVEHVRLRVTFACEPCAHGANLADVTMRQFRQIRRYLAVVQVPGSIAEDAAVIAEPDAYPAVPDNFRARTAWALDHIPQGRAVTSVEFLTAIGASRSYLRTLPRWLHAAAEQGKPAHRVLTASMTAPSWAPDALRMLAEEGTRPGAPYDLTGALWFATTPSA